MQQVLIMLPIFTYALVVGVLLGYVLLVAMPRLRRTRSKSASRTRLPATGAVPGNPHHAGADQHVSRTDQ